MAYIVMLCVTTNCKLLVDEPDEKKVTKVAYQYFFIKNPAKVIPIEYATITQEKLHDLLFRDRIAASMRSLLVGKYIHKIIINGGGGYYTNTRLKISLDQIPHSGLAKGISDDSEVRRAQIGTDPSLDNLFKFNGLGWRDVKKYTNSKSLYFVLDSKWGSNIDTFIYYWFTTPSKISNISYELLDEYADDLGSITIYCYEN